MKKSLPFLLRAAIACGGTLALALPTLPTDAQTDARAEPKLRLEIDPSDRIKPSQTPGVLFPQPDVSIVRESPLDPALVGQGGSSSVPNQPLRPTLPRAVAPPVGDISVSTIDASPSSIDLNTTALVPRLVLREAPVREVLSLLARSANLNLVFDERGGEGADNAVAVQTVSIDLENEPVQEVFNAVLQVSGLQASRKGSIIFVSPNLPQSAQKIVSRTYRLNEVEAATAASFLATQGAATQQVFEEVVQIVNPETGEIIREIPQPPRIISVNIERDEAGETPLLLAGLSISTDDRLNALTVVGEPRQVEIATTLIKQLDARQRQVAVNVKIVDVNLLNTEDFNASVSFGVGDAFFVSDNGAAAVNFGGNNPPSQAQTTVPGGFTPPVVSFDDIGITDTGEPFFDFQPDAPFGGVSFPVAPGTPAGSVPGIFARPGFGTESNPFQPGVTELEVNDDGTADVEFELPELFQTPTDFLATLTAQITSGNAKILTDPTLVIQESEVAAVNLTSEILSGVVVGADGSVAPNIREAGLTLDIAVSRIDDNGFISLNVNPSVTAPSGSVDSGVAGQGTVGLLSTRSLASGLIRLRDGQTLILSGIIQESDTVNISKVPILGDLPIIGALFRSTNRTNQRQEIVVLVTPRILDESLSGGGFGFDANFSPDTRQLLQERNFDVPGNSQ